MRQVDVDVPLHVFAADRGEVQVDLDTFVGHVADVGIVGRVTQRRCRGECHQHVGRLAVEVLDATRYAVLEHAEFDTGVEVGIGLPGDVGITFLQECHGHLSIRRSEPVGIHITVVTDLVVTLRTDRCLDLQHVEPAVRPGHEILLGYDPCGTYRPEVAPAVRGMEARRGIAAVRSREEIFTVVIVLRAAEIAFIIIGDDIRSCALLVDYRTGQFVVVGREHVGRAAVKQVLPALVVFMAEHYIDIVLADDFGVVEDLLKVVREITRMVFAYDTVLIGELSEIGVLYGRPAGLVERNTYIESEFEILQEQYVEESRAVEGIAFRTVGVQAGIRQTVRIRQQGTGQTGVHSVSVVVHRDAGVVLHDISLPVTDVEGIDGGYGRGEGEEVGRRVSLPVRAQRIVGEVCVTGVGTDLQPFLGLIVCLQTCRVTLHVRIFRDTLVVQVTERSIERAAIRSTRYTDVIFLAHRGAESDVFPVIGREQIILAVVEYMVTQRGVGIEFPVGADNRLAVGDTVNHIAQTAVVFRSGEVLIGHGVCGALAHTLRAVVAAERRIVGFVVLRRAFDIIIGLHCA